MCYGSMRCMTPTVKKDKGDVGLGANVLCVKPLSPRTKKFLLLFFFVAEQVAQGTTGKFEEAFFVLFVAKQMTHGATGNSKEAAGCGWASTVLPWLPPTPPLPCAQLRQPCTK